MCRELQARSVDCFTWPVFSKSYVDEDKWGTLLMVPVCYDISDQMQQSLLNIQ